MKDLLMLIATALPKNKLVDEIIEKATEYKKCPTDDNFISLSIWCHMISIKEVLDHTDKDPIKAFVKLKQDMDKMEKGNNLLIKTNQKS
jgi:hypothetical protein